MRHIKILGSGASHNKHVLLANEFIKHLEQAQVQIGYYPKLQAIVDVKLYGLVRETSKSFEHGEADNLHTAKKFYQQKISDDCHGMDYSLFYSAREWNPWKQMDPPI